MRADVWSDYLCPWCYLGLDQTARIEGLGVPVTARPYELHPDVPLDGRVVRAGGRMAATFARVGALCAEVGLPFRAPTRVPNTRRALETAAIVREDYLFVAPRLDRALFAAVFEHAIDISTPAVLDELVAACGADPLRVRARVDAGEGADAVRSSMAEAIEHGIAATPAWLVDGTLVIPGVQPAETVERWIRRMQAKEVERTARPETS